MIGGDKKEKGQSRGRGSYVITTLTIPNFGARKIVSRNASRSHLEARIRNAERNHFVIRSTPPAMIDLIATNAEMSSS
jgi:hypothetical protein